MTFAYDGHLQQPCARLWLRWMTRIVTELLCLLFIQGTARAGELDEISVTRRGDTYEIRVEILMSVAADRVREVLTDYAHIYRLNPSITETEVLNRSVDDGVVRVRTRFETCVVAFCVKAERVEDVRELASGDLRATIVPELSDFSHGSAHCQILPETGGTRIIYRALVEPDIFVPPLVESYLLKRVLRREIIATLGRLECIAGAASPAPTVQLVQNTEAPDLPRSCPG